MQSPALSLLLWQLPNPCHPAPEFPFLPPPTGLLLPPPRSQKSPALQGGSAPPSSAAERVPKAGSSPSPVYKPEISL